MTALIVIGICFVCASLGSIFGKPNEGAAAEKDQRGWWPGSPRRR